MAPVSEADILSEVVLPDQPSLATALLELRFGDSAIEKMNLLAEKNRLGTLDSREQQSLENYQRVGRLLNLLHAKARLAIHGHSDISSRR